MITCGNNPIKQILPHINPILELYQAASAAAVVVLAAANGEEIPVEIYSSRSPLVQKCHRREYESLRAACVVRLRSWTTVLTPSFQIYDLLPHPRKGQGR